MGHSASLNWLPPVHRKSAEVLTIAPGCWPGVCWRTCEMSQSINPGTESDFSLEWYKLHRGHELELNKAALAYEHERLKFLAYLNGGAAGAFLTFFAAMWKDSPRPGLSTFVAIACWTVGLCMAWWAWTVAHRGQSAFVTAYRMRRYAEEFRREPHLRAGIEERYPPPRSAPDPPSFEGLHKAADAWRKEAAQRGSKAWVIANASVLLFAAGAISACYGLAIKSTEPVKSVQGGSARQATAPDGRDGRDGAPGRDGLPGRDGINGRPGRDSRPSSGANSGAQPSGTACECVQVK
jgi:hypothetical protein